MLAFASEYSSALSRPAPSGSALVLDLPGLERVLPDGGFTCGQVTELASQEHSGLSTLLALKACCAAQERGALTGGHSWCAFIDASRGLFAPAVAASGVTLSRLLVASPPVESIQRVALKIVESRAFSVVVIDAQPSLGEQFAASEERGVAGSRVASLTSWGRIVRRLALAIRGTQTVVLLLTDQNQKRAVSLPVGMRVELARGGSAVSPKLEVTIAKDNRGRITGKQTLSLASGFKKGVELKCEMRKGRGAPSGELSLVG